MTRVIVAGGGTGGHLYPGLAIARALVRLRPDIVPFFVGARRGIERDILPQTEFAHVLLDLHPLYRSRPWENWRTLHGAAGAWRRIAALVRAERPAMVIGTGGYAAGAMLGYAVRHRLPLVLEETNSYPGITTRFFARWAREVYLGYPEAEHLLPHRAGTTFIDTGNPIQPPPSPRPDRAAARRSWGFPERGGHVLLIFGGSQGARALNQVVDAWLSRGVPEGLYVIWGTGKRNHEQHAHLEGERVRVRPYLSPIADAYAAADVALTRSGGTTAELCAWGLPMVLVPLPTAAADHQTANAVALERAGAAVHLPQRSLTPDVLAGTMERLLADPAALDRLAAAALARGRPNAAEEIARRVLALIDAGARRS